MTKKLISLIYIYWIAYFQIKQEKYKMTKKKAKCSNKKKTKKFDDPYKGITLLNIDDESTKKLISEIKLQRQKQNKFTKNGLDEKQEKTEP